VKTVAWGKLLLGVFSSSDHAGSPRINHLSGKLLRSIQEECTPRPTTKPIVETYSEDSSTFQRNGSTEVPEKEERDVGKRCKGLIEKKKGRKESQIEEARPIWYQLETRNGGRRLWLRAQNVLLCGILQQIDGIGTDAGTAAKLQQSGARVGLQQIAGHDV
jgi:hypothetical protein